MHRFEIGSLPGDLAIISFPFWPLRSHLIICWVVVSRVLFCSMI